jgi:hypothetical protein
MAAKIVFSLVLPPLVWLVYGAPHLSLAGNLALLTVISVHLYLVIWSDLVWSLFGADRFTYRMAGMGLNFTTLSITLALGAYLSYSANKQLVRVSSIAPSSWAIFGLAILATLLVPMLSSNRVSPLPKISERREFENPTTRR